MDICRWTLFVFVIFTVKIALTDGEIHRAKTNSHKTSGKNSRVWEYVASKTVADDMFGSQTFDTWIFAILGSCLVGLSGIFPLFIIPIEAGPTLKHGAAAKKLKLLLSFAVGGLLGDVFLHLLPEAWDHLDKGNHHAHTVLGLWVLAGIISFLVIEKIFAKEGEYEHIQDECDEVDSDNNKNSTKENSNKTPSHIGSIRKRNTNTKSTENGIKHKNKPTAEDKTNSIKVSGYLNLLANVIDNFTHGLAIAGSFLVSNKVGAVTTVAILLHEVPHEIGDFAILLRSGFDRWKAAKAQDRLACKRHVIKQFNHKPDRFHHVHPTAVFRGTFWAGLAYCLLTIPLIQQRLGITFVILAYYMQMLTASGGLIGTITALTAESAQSAGESTAWILPFTSGGFIYIALVTVVPDLLEEKHGRESFKQVLCLCAGITSMALVSIFH